MTVNATGGAKLYIGVSKPQKKTDYVLADFSAANAATWKEIGELEALGQVGDTSEAINFTAIGDKRTRTIKGPRSAGNMELVMGVDYTDVGQQALIAAQLTIHDYEFRLVLNDAPADGTPSERLFIAKVMSQAEQYDQANSIMKLNASLGVNSNLVRVDAEEA